MVPEAIFIDADQVIASEVPQDWSSTRPLNILLLMNLKIKKMFKPLGKDDSRFDLDFQLVRNITSVKEV